jgi:hypothetical protein
MPEAESKRVLPSDKLGALPPDNGIPLNNVMVRGHIDPLQETQAGEKRRVEPEDRQVPERSNNVSFIAVSHVRGRDGMDRETFSLL